MATAGMAVMVLASAGVIDCTGGRCEAANQADEITGTHQRDRIFALNGFDEVFARGEDDLNGGNLGKSSLWALFGKSGSSQRTLQALVWVLT